MGKNHAHTDSAGGRRGANFSAPITEKSRIWAFFESLKIK